MPSKYIPTKPVTAAPADTPETPFQKLIRWGGTSVNDVISDEAGKKIDKQTEEALPFQQEPYLDPRTFLKSLTPVNAAIVASFGSGTPAIIANTGLGIEGLHTAADSSKGTIERLLGGVSALGGAFGVRSGLAVRSEAKAAKIAEDLVKAPKVTPPTPSINPETQARVWPVPPKPGKLVANETATPAVAHLATSVDKPIAKAIDEAPNALTKLDSVDDAIKAEKAAGKKTVGVNRKTEAGYKAERDAAIAARDKKNLADVEKWAADKENARKLKLINAAKEGRVETAPSIGESLSAKTPEGGSTSMSRRFVEPVEEGVDVDGVVGGSGGDGPSSGGGGGSTSGRTVYTADQLPPRDAVEGLTIRSEKRARDLADQYNLRGERVDLHRNPNGGFSIEFKSPKPGATPPVDPALGPTPGSPNSKFNDKINKLLGKSGVNPPDEIPPSVEPPTPTPAPRRPRGPKGTPPSAGTPGVAGKVARAGRGTTLLDETITPSPTIALPKPKVSPPEYPEWTGDAPQATQSQLPPSNAELASKYPTSNREIDLATKNLAEGEYSRLLNLRPNGPNSPRLTAAEQAEVRYLTDKLNGRDMTPAKEVTTAVKGEENVPLPGIDPVNVGTKVPDVAEAPFSLSGQPATTTPVQPKLDSRSIVQQATADAAAADKNPVTTDAVKELAARVKQDLRASEPPAVPEGGAIPARLFKTRMEATGANYGAIKDAKAAGEQVPEAGRAIAGKTAAAERRAVEGAIPVADTQGMLAKAAEIDAARARTRASASKLVSELTPEALAESKARIAASKAKTAGVTSADLTKLQGDEQMDAIMKEVADFKNGPSEPIPGPSVKEPAAAAPIAETKVKVRKTKDFDSNGEYEVDFGNGKKTKMFYDRDSQTWYESKPTKNKGKALSGFYSDIWGHSKQEMIDKLTKAYGGPVRPKGSSTVSALGGGQLENMIKIASENPAFTRALTTAVGAGTGAATSDDPTTGALVGGAIGFGAPTALNLISKARVGTGDPAAAQAKFKDVVDTFARMMPDFQRFSLLSKATPLIMNAIVGPWGGMIMKGIELTASGDARGLKLLNYGVNPMNFKKLAQAYGRNIPKAAGLIGDAAERTEGLMGRQNYSALLGKKGSELYNTVTQYPGVLMTAGDETAREFAKLAGLTEDEARAMSLTNEPYTSGGAALSKFKKGAINRETGKRSWFVDMALPFYRTATNQVESGLERMPGVGIWMNKYAKKVPAPIQVQLAQQVIGGSSGYAGYIMGEQTPPEDAKNVLKFLNNFGGQYGMLMSAGFMMGQASARGSSSWKALTSELANALPTPSTQPATDLLQNAGALGDTLGLTDTGAEAKIPSGFIPGILDPEDPLTAAIAGPLMGTVAPNKPVSTNRSRYIPTRRR